MARKELAEISDFRSLKKIMAAHGVTQLFAKPLAPNDNSKNQIYLGGGFEALNLIPNHGVEVDEGTRAASKRDRFKAFISLSWVDADGCASPAPNAQLILYPKYPEVRMSGMLLGAEHAPSSLIASRLEGRILFLGVCHDGSILGHVSAPDSPIRKEIENIREPNMSGVFIRIPLDGTDTKQLLIEKLRSIHLEGWIDSIRLNAKGEILPCRASNCGGYTLEAKLGITPNGYAEPDYLGWEVKQHGVTSLDKPHSGGPITLMTPEPTAGIYKEAGVEYFLRTFGYPDQKGREDRINFGGIFRNGVRAARTGLTLTLTGYDSDSGKITSADGGITLMDDSGREAATWLYADMMKHWNRKHAQAVYIPSMCRTNPSRQYTYGSQIDLGEGTDFHKFLRAVADGHVYYDPGIKLENASSSKPTTKRRSQFRIKPAHLSGLYQSMRTVDIANNTSQKAGI